MAPLEELDEELDEELVLEDEELEEYQGVSGIGSPLGLSLFLQPARAQIIKPAQNTNLIWAPVKK